MLNPNGLEYNKTSAFTFNNKKNQTETFQKPEQLYDKMTLKDYIELKNLQRKLQTQASNYLKGISPPISEQKQIQIHTLVFNIKQYIKGIIGQGSLYHKFHLMMQNLIKIFMIQINLSHKLRVQKQKAEQDIRITQFRITNDRISEYLKTCEKEQFTIQEKIQRIKKNRQMFKKQRENKIIQNQQMKKSKMLEDQMLMDKEQAQPAQKIDINKLFVQSNNEKQKNNNMFLNPNNIKRSQMR